ncbi:helix-turn-helix domain-containing protein [Bacteroides rodentium]|uniref:helix-turn-helix domain-containing protein n=1 Tax=Bacteroides rodentium TaxID=691816 RepID=UPI00046FCD5F|nr:helix-turn-helix domain-containing protein [Bacteroides rodentium]
MTRNDAKMIAEELYKLMRKDVKQLVCQSVREEAEEWLTTKQAAELMGMSVSYIEHSDIPHTKVGRLNRYKKSDIVKLMNR